MSRKYSPKPHFTEALSLPPEMAMIFKNDRRSEYGLKKLLKKLKI